MKTFAGRGADAVAVARIAAGAAVPRSAHGLQQQVRHVGHPHVGAGRALLLAGGDKSSQARDIEQAITLARNYKE